MHLRPCYVYEGVYVCFCCCSGASERSLTWARWRPPPPPHLEFALFKCLKYCAWKTPLMCHNSVCMCVDITSRHMANQDAACPISTWTSAVKCKEAKSHLMIPSLPKLTQIVTFWSLKVSRVCIMTITGSCGCQNRPFVKLMWHLNCSNKLQVWTKNLSYGHSESLGGPENDCYYGGACNLWQ